MRKIKAVGVHLRAAGLLNRPCLVTFGIEQIRVHNESETLYNTVCSLQSDSQAFLGTFPERQSERRLSARLQHCVTLPSGIFGGISSADSARPPQIPIAC